MSDDIFAGLEWGEPIDCSIEVGHEEGETWLTRATLADGREATVFGNTNQGFMGTIWPASKNRPSAVEEQRMVRIPMAAIIKLWPLLALTPRTEDAP